MKLKTMLITTQNQQALALTNEPFCRPGTFEVTRLHSEWCYKLCFYPTSQISTETFPEENYQLEQVNDQGFAVGTFAYDLPVGLGIFKDHPFQYLYLEDLKVSRTYRQQGVAQKILKFASKLALHQGYAGIFTICQSNNLNACLFYLACGFKIGGLNTQVYAHTSQAGKENIYFYLDF
ncbi:MAG TPA: GNAT family N-acetyltransferase [Candidatus Ligilactobacillus excrementipullorum]|nr:GNAT family N-acetyltransferase [Candidatus Ligilactobacillus excrementipullorum]